MAWLRAVELADVRPDTTRDGETADIGPPGAAEPGVNHHRWYAGDCWGRGRAWSRGLRRLSDGSGVDVASRGAVDSAPVEQFARHVHLPEALRQMVKNATLYAPMIAPVPGRDRGRGVPTTR